MNEDAGNSGKRRGRSEQHPVDELKKIALKIKKELNGAKLTHLGLEKKTGIGRNTWARKIPDFIDQLNHPIEIQRRLDSNADVYYPNFTALLEICDDKNELLNELVEFERQFQKKDAELARLEKELHSMQKYKKKLESELVKTENYKKQALHYKALYEQLTVSSAFPHLRKELGIRSNLLEFPSNKQQNISLKNLESNFPTKLDDIDLTDRLKENTETLKSLVPELLD